MYPLVPFYHDCAVILWIRWKNMTSGWPLLSVSKSKFRPACRTCRREPADQGSTWWPRKITPSYWRWPVTWVMQGRSRVTINWLIAECNLLRWCHLKVCYMYYMAIKLFSLSLSLSLFSSFSRPVVDSLTKGQQWRKNSVSSSCQKMPWCGSEWARILLSTV